MENNEQLAKNTFTSVL